MAETKLGRPKGTPNRITAIIKEALMESFDRVGRAEYLVRMAEEEPKAYLQLLAKVLPHEIQAEMKVTDARPPLVKRRAVEVIDGEVVEATVSETTTH